MADETKHGIECTEFEGLVSDALEGLLSPAGQESFDAHWRVCPTCGPLFADVRAGQQWLRALEAVEPPAHLVHNILVATTGVLSTRPLAAAADGRTTPFGERLRERWDLFSASFFRPVAAFVRQPRFVMSFGMIFFSFSLALSAAGVKASDVSKVDLRPTALRHAYNDAQIRVVQYYDNIRFVYEIESMLRERKRANPPAEPGPGSNDQKGDRKNNNTSGQPEQRQDRNYSQDYNQPVLAEMTEGSNEAPSYELHAASYEQTQACSRLEARSSKPPVVTVSTNRRFV
jgi:hypothetical protein